MNATMTPANGLAKWDVFYKIINNCNLVLKYAPEVAEIDPNYTKGKLEVHLAEALSLRALAYFYLVRIYRDVPFITYPYLDDTEDFDVPKTDGDVILNNMIEDLKTAKRYAVIARGAGTDYKMLNKGRITKNAVRAILADIYLWQASGRRHDPALQTEEYLACISECDEVGPIIENEYQAMDLDKITGAELLLISNEYYDGNSWLTQFNRGDMGSNSYESIFELQFNDRTTSEKISDLYGRDDQRGKLNASNKVTWINQEADVRKKYSISIEMSGGFYYILKYVMTSFLTNVTTGEIAGYMMYSKTNYPNWILYRLPDVYLMKAEALVELGRLDEALELVNKIYLRSNPDLDGKPLTLDKYSTQAEMQALVLDERQREFLFEGKRWFDLLRVARRESVAPFSDGFNPEKMLSYLMQKYKDVTVVKSKLSIYNALFMPIHKDELTANEALSQNPYYNTILEK
jgi:hypothetical protein